MSNEEVRWKALVLASVIVAVFIAIAVALWGSIDDGGPAAAQAGEVPVRANGEAAGVFSRAGAVQHASELIGFTVSEPQYLPAGVSLQGIDVVTAGPPPGASVGRVTVTYEEGTSGSEKALIIEQYERGPAVHAGDPEEWRVNTSVEGEVTFSTFTRIEGLDVTVVSVRGDGIRPFDVTAINLREGDAMAVARSMPALGTAD